jgi:FkbH-like protein
MIKCVIWDLDDTLLDGVYLESPDQPPPVNAELASLLAELASRGILHAVASKNPPEAASYAARATGHAFAATACGWGAKPAAITTIMTDLGLAADEVAFVDNEALERAEVSFSLPDVLVLAPGEVADAAGWPRFSPPVVTDEARRRGELYAQRRARQEEARAFGGSRDEFLRYCQTRLTIGPADRSDLPRLHELSVRTHQFSSAGQVVSEAAFRKLLTSPVHRVITARLSDRFGDDGLVGCCVIEDEGAQWQVWPLMMSCRAMGRGVIDALLAWICRAASDAGAGEVRLPCVINPRNVPLRIALVAAGFRVGHCEPADQPALYVRSLDQVPELPDWVTVSPM